MSSSTVTPVSASDLAMQVSAGYAKTGANNWQTSQNGKSLRIQSVPVAVGHRLIG